jgi:hypothetical protein
VLVLLSVKAGLRAGEIANLTWPMLAEPTGEIGKSLELQGRAEAAAMMMPMATQVEISESSNWKEKPISLCLWEQ